MRAIVLLTLLLLSSVAMAQTGTLRGVITDESGAVVPGATVVFTPNAGTASTVITASDGSYSFVAPPGNYIVEATAPDLKSGPVKVAVRQGLQSLDLQLKVALAAQQVTVEERAVAVTPEPTNSVSARF